MRRCVPREGLGARSLLCIERQTRQAARERCIELRLERGPSRAPRRAGGRCGSLAVLSPRPAERGERAVREAERWTDGRTQRWVDERRTIVALVAGLAHRVNGGGAGDGMVLVGRCALVEPFEERGVLTRRAALHGAGQYLARVAQP